MKMWNVFASLKRIWKRSNETIPTPSDEKAPLADRYIKLPAKREGSTGKSPKGGRKPMKKKREP